MKRCVDCKWFRPINATVICLKSENYWGTLECRLNGRTLYVRKWWKFWRDK